MKIIILNKVEKFFTSLNSKELAKLIRTIELLEEFGDKLGMPHSRHLSDGLIELRIRGKREVRVLYCFYKNKAVLLHAFIKKSQITVKKEIVYGKTVKNNLHKYNI
ncbi:type II toxin-antitoxin system RelE/ParE family toxin [Candidatus Nomurabacteria bacterium]|nr:type II toxin-antitoxin system RelE/ParE family toxin [Candidatus Nomurabacteria bacterium]